MSFTPTKLYYKISEVCEIVGVESYVLRYWETEFQSLSPPKNRSGQRTYRPKDIELLLRIKKLLYEDGFTISGARKQLAGGKEISQAEPAGTPVRKRAGKGAQKREKPAADRISKVRDELENILTLLDRE